MHQQFRNFFVWLSLVAGMLFAGYPQAASAQGDVTFSPDDEYYLRLLQITGVSDHVSSYNLRPIRTVTEPDAAHPWSNLFGLPDSSAKRSGFKPTIIPYQASLFQSYNSTLPRGNSDGALWQGKGHNIGVSGGLEATAGVLKIRFRPVLVSSQNRPYDLGPQQAPFIFYPEIGYREPGSIYTYRYIPIDYVQRYGDSRHTRLDLGESAVELNYKSMRVALSNEKIWTGPSQNTALLLGYSAPGFHHLYVGTNRPAATLLGSFEFAYIFGRMVKSDYFDNIDYRNSQSVNAFLLSYSPWFAKNRFSVGLLRSFFAPYPSSFDEFRNEASKLFESPLKDSRGREDEAGAGNDNQVFTVFTRYYIPSSGFEAYLEYGRNDHNANFRDFLGQPSHQRAYTIGLTKAGQLSGNRILSVNLEMNQLESTRTSVTRGGATFEQVGFGIWYYHGSQIMGITNRGQIPGSGYGPGMNMQQIRGDLFSPRGRIGVKFARIVYHNSFVNGRLYSLERSGDPAERTWETRNIELMAGVKASFISAGKFEISAALEQSFILNQHFISGNDINNTRIELVVKTLFNGWKR